MPEKPRNTQKIKGKFFTSLRRSAWGIFENKSRFFESPVKAKYASGYSRKFLGETARADSQQGSVYHFNYRSATATVPWVLLLVVTHKGSKIRLAHNGYRYMRGLNLYLAPPGVRDYLIDKLGKNDVVSYNDMLMASIIIADKFRTYDIRKIRSFSAISLDEDEDDTFGGLF